MSERQRFPERPALTPSLYALVCVVMTERWCLARGSVTLPMLALPLLPLASAALRRFRGACDSSSERRDDGVIVTCACAMLASMLVSWVTLTAGYALASSLSSSSISSWSFEVLSDPRETRYGLRCRARASRDGSPSGDVWLTTTEVLEMGDVVRGVGRFKTSDDETWAQSSRQQGVWGTVSLLRATRKGRAGGVRGVALLMRREASAALDATQSDGRAVLAGCVLGDRRALDERSLSQLFAACGVSHLVAVSGSHLVVVSALVGAVVMRLRMRPPLRLVIISLLTGTFVLVCGAPASAVRSWLMAVAAMAAQLVGRRVDPLSSVCLVALAMALVEPAVTGQLGYLLSVSCVISLALFSYYVAYLVDQALPVVPRLRCLSSEQRIKIRKLRAGAVGSLASSLVAQVATLPLTGPLFCRLSLVAPLAVLLAMPSISASLALGLVGSLLVPLPLCSRPVLALAEVAASCSVVILRMLARLPMASIPIEVDGLRCGLVLLAVAFALLVFWPKPTKRQLVIGASSASLLCVLFVARWRLFAPARICVLDVGQGDAILVQDGHAAVLIDTGPDSSVVRALARSHVMHLDAVVLTHLHDDHYGGVASLAGAVGCDVVIAAEGSVSHMPEELSDAVRELARGDCREVRYGDVLHVGRFELAVVWPHAPVSGEENAHSIELLVTYERAGCRLTGLLTGDAERKETGAVIGAHDVGDIDFLKVGHHGSEVSLDEDEARTLLPEVSVASAGEGNRYGHPSDECVQVLEEVGSVFLCTKDVGDVEIMPGRDGPRIRCHKDGDALGLL